RLGGHLRKCRLVPPGLFHEPEAAPMHRVEAFGARVLVRLLLVLPHGTAIDATAPSVRAAAVHPDVEVIVMRRGVAGLPHHERRVLAGPQRTRLAFGVL